LKPLKGRGRTQSTLLGKSEGCHRQPYAGGKVGSMKKGPPFLCEGDFYALHDQDSWFERNGFDIHDGISAIAKSPD
jgi:hypothetical protein